MLKKLSRFLLWDVLVLALVSCFVVLILNLLVRPDRIKSWLSSSGIYSTLTDGLVQQTSSQLSQKNISGVPLDNPDVQQAVKTAFPPKFWQQSSEQTISSMFRWLEGKTSQPDLTINIQPNKTILATEIAAAARKRVESLPACPPRQLPSGTNPFEISCRPVLPGVNDLIVAGYIAKLQDSPDFLPNTNINIQTLLAGEQNKTAVPFSSNSKYVRLYGYVRVLPYVLVGMILGLVLLLTFTAQSRITSLRGTGIGIIVVAVLCGAVLAATSYGLQTVRSKFTEQRTQNAIIDSSRLSIDKLFEAIDHDLTRSGTIILGSYGAFGGVMIISSLVLVSSATKRQRKELGIEQKQGKEQKSTPATPASNVADAKAKFQAAMKNTNKQ